jgi:hypothetical protein
MKKNVIIVLICLLNSTFITAQSKGNIIKEENIISKWTNFNPKFTFYPEITNILEGSIDENYTLTNNQTYLLKGAVYVTNNSTLTIEAGTIIRGDDITCGTLVITKGSKIIADGTKNNPIIFTSNKESVMRKSGDWGGIIILGDANTNKLGGINFLELDLDKKNSMYGGNNIEDNSGILNYIRIEYAGRKLIKHSKELNGLSLAGVGNKTKISNIQISFSNDDSFEFYGGTIEATNLISFKATDDDFDFTQGADINLTNSIAIRNPYNSDASRSRCFEIDTYDDKETSDLLKKVTTVIATNMVLINIESNNQGLTKEAIYISEDSKLQIKNSIISGFRSAINLHKNINVNSENFEKILIEKCLINDCIYFAEKEISLEHLDLANYFSNEKFKNISKKLGKNELFINANVDSNPDFRLKKD